MFLTIYLLSCFAISNAIINGVIWSKEEKKFVRISDNPLIDELKGKLIKEEHFPYESQDLMGERVRLVYYNTPFYFEFNDDGTIGGFIGDIWNLVSYRLNFTIEAIRVNDTNFGELLDNGTYTGLLGHIYNNEADVIPRVRVDTIQLDLVDYIPLWKTSYDLYYKAIEEPDKNWLAGIFDPVLWLMIIGTMILLGISSIFMRRYVLNEQYKISISDNIMTTIAVYLNQVIRSEELVQQPRVMFLIKAAFTFIILQSFNSGLLSNMATWVLIPPFKDFGTLAKSKYNVVILKSSLKEINFINNGLISTKRIKIVDTPEEAFDLVCSSEKNYATIMDYDDVNIVEYNIPCDYDSTSLSYYENWMGSILLRNSKLKRPLDIAIARIIECGVARHIWSKYYFPTDTDPSPKKHNSVGFYSILPQMNVMLFGLILSFIILLIELLTHYVRCTL